MSNNSHIVRAATVPGTNDGSFAPHRQAEGDPDQVLSAEAAGQRYLRHLTAVEEQIRTVDEQRMQLMARVHTLHLAQTAAELVAENPDATCLELVSWSEEVDDFGGFEITYGEVTGADGCRLDGLSGYGGSMSSTNLHADQPWAEAYIDGPGENWDGTLDLRKLIVAGQRVAQQLDDQATSNHLEKVCAEAGLETMADILDIVRNREEVLDARLEELTADDITDMYDSWVGPAVDGIERSLLGDEDDE